MHPMAHDRGVVEFLINSGQSKGMPPMDKVEQDDTVAVSAPVVPSPEMDSVALQRLIAEVRTSEPVMSGNYNRTYNRHNR